MKLPRQALVPRSESRGAALVLSFMVLLVLILILAQIKYSTDTNSRVARNEETLLSMDNAIESCLFQVFEDLKSDAQSDGGGAGSGAPLGGGGGAPSGAGSGGAAGGAAGGEDNGPTDSKEDEWARAQRTEVNEIQVRILIQDEDSKFNVLSVLTEDEDEADKAVDRLARVIEWSRKGTKAEIDGSTASRMADAMTEFMRRRNAQVLPRPALLSDREDEKDQGLPLSLREFAAIDPELFPPDLFRDFIDENGDIVHSLGTFLTVWSSVETAEEALNASNPEESSAPSENDDSGAGSGQGGGQENESPGDSPSQGGGANAAQENQNGSSTPTGQGGGQNQPPPGWAININTAPGAVLHALMDDRELPYRFWDDVVNYRNEKDDTVEENDDPPLDEYGKPILVHQFFHSIGDLAKVDGWDNLEPTTQGELRNLLKTQSQVFSIYVTARKPTGEEKIEPFSRREDIESEEADWQGLVRTVRAVVWRRTLSEGEVELVPIVRWEVLDYVPFEVLDFPEDRNYR